VANDPEHCEPNGLCGASLERHLALDLRHWRRTLLMVRVLEDGSGSNSAERRLKVPPNSIEAEQSLIGGLMLDNVAWDKVADLVVSEDFYRKDHRLIFSAIAMLAEDGQACDVVTLSEFLDNRGELNAAGGLEYLATLANETPGAANVRAQRRKEKQL
jgi:replicative DNA helicase